MSHINIDIDNLIGKVVVKGSPKSYAKLSDQVKEALLSAVDMVQTELKYKNNGNEVGLSVRVYDVEKHSIHSLKLKLEKFNNHSETLLTNRLEENHKKDLEIEQFFNQLRNSFSTSKATKLTEKQHSYDWVSGLVTHLANLDPNKMRLKKELMSLAIPYNIIEKSTKHLE